MPADQADGPGGRAAALGFHSYADDTLRIVPESRSETGDDADPRDWPDAGSPRRGSAIVVAAGLALIAGLAVAFAWSVTPGRRPAPEARPPAAAAPPAPRLQAETASPPQPQSPPQTASSALAMTLRAAPPPPARSAAPPVRAAEAPPGRDPVGDRLAALSPALAAPTPAATPAPTPILALTPEPAPAPAPEPAPPAAQARLQPAFDCAAARTAGQQMVCGDPDLAAADRRMDRAYRAALAAGAPEDQLRLEQQDWVGIREDAARHSRRAVAQIYEQRIDDLRRWRAEAAADREPER